MKYRLLFSISLLAVLWITTFQPTKLIAQSDNYTVRIVSPKADSLNHWNKCPGVNYVFQAEGLNSDGSAFDPSQVTFTWDFGYHGQSKSGSVVSFTYPEGGHYTIRLTVTGKSGKPNSVCIFSRFPDQSAWPHLYRISHCYSAHLRWWPNQKWK